jgi:hypothetical protein
MPPAKRGKQGGIRIYDLSASCNTWFFGCSWRNGGASQLKDIVSYICQGGCLRCARCGNDNPETNRFCGMCGATLLEAPAATPSQGERPASSPTAAAPAASRQEPAAERTPAPSVEKIRGITGPSFLGLSDEPPRGRRRGLSIDPDAHGPRNLDYLLEDEEEHKGSGAGKVFLILLALLLAVGFGYLRWKNQGLPWLGLSRLKPSATTQNSNLPEGNAAASATPDAGAGQPATTATPATATPGTSVPANGGNSTAPAPAGGQMTPAPSAPTGHQAAASQPAASQSASTADTANQPAAQPAPAQTAPAQIGVTPAAGGAGNSGGDQAASAAQPAAGKDAMPVANAAPTNAEKPQPEATPPSKPHAAVAAPRPDPVSEAQRYLYGQHVPQDCNRGLRILKPAADSGNPKAMIEMGALYSAGLCTPRDLPTSYRWFALALRKDPNNTSLQADLQKLWGEMTQPERQLAIRLSQ